MLEADAIDSRLDGAVEKLDDQDEQHRRDEQCALDTRASQPQTQRYDDGGEREFLAKRGLVAECARKAAPARATRANETGESARLGSIDSCAGARRSRRSSAASRGIAQGSGGRTGGAVGFHVRSSCFAARTSSRRRTDMLCGALVTRSGSCSASRSICTIASTNASSVCLLSVSVGSM